MEGKRILIYAGSTREGSYNKNLGRIATKLLAPNNAVTWLDLKQYPLPLYDGDDEQSLDFPESAKKLKALFKSHSIHIISSPEYNSSISGVLKNTIDWVSRSEEKGGDLSAFSGKTAILLSASPSMYGGMRALVHLRLILSSIGTNVLPHQFSLGCAHKAFDGEQFKESKELERLKSVLYQLG